MSDYKTQLLEEQEQLEAELTKIARVNPQNKNDWEVKPVGDVTETREEVADELEELENRSEVETRLEERLSAVKLALEKLESDLYGQCEVCQKAIEPERLEANPAARTCMEH